MQGGGETAERCRPRLLGRVQEKEEWGARRGPFAKGDSLRLLRWQLSIPDPPGRLWSLVNMPLERSEWNADSQLERDKYCWQVMII